MKISAETFLNRRDKSGGRNDAAERARDQANYPMYPGHIATALAGHRNEAAASAMKTAAHNSASLREIRMKLAPRCSQSGYARRIQ